LSASHYEIGHTLLEYEDPSANMTLSQIVKLPATQFSPVTQAVPSHGFTQSAFWYRFEVENKKDMPLTRLIVFEPSWLDHVDVSVVSASGKMRSYEGGNAFIYAHRAVDHHLITVRHAFEPGKSTVYVRVKTPDPFIVSLSVASESAFFQKNVEVTLCAGLIYGGIIAMLFYNLFLFFGIKERYYALYVLYLFAFLFMNAAYNGYTYVYLFYDYPLVQDWAQSSGIFLFSIAGLLFATSFLNLSTQHPRLYKLTSCLIVFIAGVGVLIALLGSYRYHVISSILFAMLVSIYIFGVALYAWIKGNSSARFFLLGATSGLVGTVITVAAVIGLIPFMRFTYKANDFGIFIDAVLLSIALADRMRMTQERKIIAEKQAKTDALTGLYNRRAYYEISELEYKKVLRYHRILSVVMFDVDEFKHINDTYGHSAGDTVLQSVATLTKETIRDYDYAFRMGGDEFLLLLPETNEKQAAVLCERLREKIEKQKITDSRGNTFFVTASFGVVEYTQRETCMESVVKRADEALYLAKKSGRNNVKILDKYAMV
ncbi:MAG: hypothetical protein B7X69_03150, partial [Sulfurovum sp. 39-42-12]